MKRRPNIEWHCVIEQPIDEDALDKMFAEIAKAAGFFEKVTAGEGIWKGSFRSGDVAVLQFWARPALLKRLRRLDNRFDKLAPQSSYRAAEAPLPHPIPEPVVVSAPGSPPKPPTPKEVLGDRFAPYRMMQKQAQELGIPSNQKIGVLRHLIDVKLKENAEKQAAEKPGFAANTQTMGKV